jgi:hypothetical protein
MKVENKSTEKVSIFLEWRRLGTSFYATIQYEEHQEGEGKSRNRNCVLRFKLTNEEANEGLNAMMEKYHWSKHEVEI